MLSIMHWYDDSHKSHGGDDGYLFSTYLCNIPNICKIDQNIKQIESRQTKLQIYLFTIK